MHGPGAPATLTAVIKPSPRSEFQDALLGGPGAATRRGYPTGTVGRLWGEWGTLRSSDRRVD
jgi:hypothetical protein